LALLLAKRFGAIHVRTHELLNQLGPSVPQERRALQEYGEQLDERTKGAWVRDGLTEAIRRHEEASLFVLDSVRSALQMEAIREAYGQRVVHVHLTADLSELERRYAQRTGTVKELSSYQEVQKNRTEKQVDDLMSIADIVIRTDRCSPNDVWSSEFHSLRLLRSSVLTSKVQGLQKLNSDPQSPKREGGRLPLVCFCVSA
jgi:adenylosuccinate synthase